MCPNCGKYRGRVVIDVQAQIAKKQVRLKEKALSRGDEPEKNIMAVRNQTGVADLRCRPMWKQWSLKPRIQFDEDQFSLQDVSNLLMRVGMQVGLGEGRPQ